MNKKLVLELGKFKKSYLEIEKLQIGNSPEFYGQDINNHLKLE